MSQIKITEAFYDVEYRTERIPGVENQADLTLGANCQVFAYALRSLHEGLIFSLKCLST